LNSSRLQVEAYQKGILAGDRVILAKAITLVESTLPEDQQLAGEIIDAVTLGTENSLRIGITGAPGVGKSTFIEAFGKMITEKGKKIAVLTIDPTSRKTGGSILGDKTRMEQLAKNPMAFIRPTPSGLALGGVASHTRESMILCEAAGYEVIVVETVGVGQSEYAIKSMVDFFLLLMLPGSGDELQGLKKGIIEMADAIAITKADGENVSRANAAKSDFQHAMHFLRTQTPGWKTGIITTSALAFKGIDEVWEIIQQFKQQLSISGFFAENRHHQKAEWFKEHFNFLLSIDYKQFPSVEIKADKLLQLIQSQKISPRKAALQLLEMYHGEIRKSGKQ
jgi:LAO/AO transport system kinase